MTSNISEGHLFMADLTGYTAYLTGSELEHAGPILSALLGSIIGEIASPLEIANLEGDAVFFHARPTTLSALRHCLRSANASTAPSPSSAGS
jgi:hypothetical protein